MYIGLYIVIDSVYNKVYLKLYANSLVFNQQKRFCLELISVSDLRGGKHPGQHVVGRQIQKKYTNTDH